MNKRMHVSVTIITLLFWLLAPVGSSLVAQPQAQEQSRSSQTGQGPTAPAELEAFLEPLMQELMDEHHIAGVAVSVVKDG